MITSAFSGNCGNHMWQYAITRAVAQKNGYEYGFNRHPDYDYFNHAPQMDFMEIDYGKEHPYTYHEIPPGITSIWDEQHVTYQHVDRYEYYPYQESIWNVPDNTKIIIHSGQDPRYLDWIKDDVRNWFRIKSEEIFKANHLMNQNGIALDKDTCIVNFRGGEYVGIPVLFLTRKYWQDAVGHMLELNPSMKFICITDDIRTASYFFNFPCFHFGISTDYYLIHHAQNLILSNSSFAILPAWLSQDAKNVIAPRWWSRHNVSNGYWCGSDIWRFGEDAGWKFLGRDGQLYDK